MGNDKEEAALLWVFFLGGPLDGKAKVLPSPLRPELIVPTPRPIAGWSPDPEFRIPMLTTTYRLHRLRETGGDEVWIYAHEDLNIPILRHLLNQYHPSTKEKP